MIHIKNSNSTGLTRKCFYTGMDFVEGLYSFETEGGLPVHPQEARKRGFAVHKSFKLPATIKDIEQLGDFGEKELGLKETARNIGVFSGTGARI